MARRLLPALIVAALIAIGSPDAGSAEKIRSAPLETPAPPAGSQRFDRLDAARTGIDFGHAWKRATRYIEQLDNGMIGGGVAVGDVDADGLPDLFVTRPYGGSRLYRNLGDFRFEDVTARARLALERWDTGASFADIDGDGDLDLYVCSYDSPNRLYINRGDGVFDEGAQRAGVAFHGASVMMAFTDYDADGDLDGYLLTNRLQPTPEQEIEIARFLEACRDGSCVVPEGLRELKAVLPRPEIGGRQVIDAGQADRLYRNDGDGTFTDVTEIAGIEGYDFGLSATWWDFDDDGLADLYVANDFHGDDQLLRNNDDGTFSDVAATALPHTPWFSMGSDAADVNNDGLIDYMGSDMSTRSHYKSKLTMGEMEENGWFLDYPTPRQYMRNALYLNTGTGRFLEAAFLSGLDSTDWTWTVRFADLDNDARVDLFVSNGMTRYWFNSDLRAQAVAAVRAGRSDLRVWLESPRRDEPNLAYRNAGDLRFESVGPRWGLDHDGVSFGAVAADLDRDGDLDLVVNHFEEPLGVYRNGSVGRHRLLLQLRGADGNRHGLGATVRIEHGGVKQMRFLTPARGFASSGEPVVHFGLGAETKIDRLEVRWPGGRTQSFSDLAADRIYTIVEGTDDPAGPDSGGAAQPWFAVSDAPGRIEHEETPFDDFARQPLLPNKLSQLGPGVAIGDADEDGDDDIYVGGAAGRPGRLLLRTALSRFTEASVPAFEADRAHEDMGALFFDADGDWDTDLYVVSGGIECEPGDPLLRDRLYLNDGEGGFDRAPADRLPDRRDSGSVVAAADFDGDGDLDLFSGSRSIPGEYPATPDSRLLRNENGRFTDVTDELAPGLRTSGLVTGAIWSDADADGRPDLLVTHEWGPVKLYLNDDGRLIDRTAEAGLSTTLGWFNGISAGDVDSDGDLDYVVTNAGLNTKYHPSHDAPARLFYGDFDGTGNRRIIEVKQTDDTLYPVRGRSCSSNAMPQLAERFPTFHDFASASLPQIYPDESLDRALTLEANTLETSLLINDGSGRFAVRPLPRLAQISPGFGVVLTEIDGDGHPDVYLVQNFFGPQPETGRMDGGVSQLLRGRDDGRFDVVWPARSGLLVPGDAKALATVDLNDDGRVDFVVTVNDGPLMAFENRSVAHRPFAVRLRGTQGNPTAVGARVTVFGDDGSRQTAEIHAGSSYLSQSTNTLFFGFAAGAIVDRVEIRWPDGEHSVRRPPFRTIPVMLNHP